MANKYAILKNNAIANIIVADDAFIAAHLPGAVRIDQITPEPPIGSTFSGGVFTPPASPPPPAPIRSALTRLELRLLFTAAELVAIDNFATSALTANQKAAINSGLITFAQSETIDLTLQHVINALTFIGSAGLITPARAAAILATKL